MTVTWEDKDRGWDAILREMFGADGASITVGVHGEEGKTPYLRKGNKGEPPTVVDIASFNEYGTSRGVPPRPFMRRTFDTKRKAWERMANRLFRLVVSKRLQVRKMMEILGLKMQTDVQTTINKSKTWAEPNAPSTIAAKTRAGKVGDQPLVNVGRLKQSIRYKVEGVGEAGGEVGAATRVSGVWKFPGAGGTIRTG